MKYLIKYFTLLIFVVAYTTFASANGKIKIGLLIPLTGENQDLGESILKSVRLAINDINDNKILIVPRDNGNDPDKTLKVAKELYNEGIKIIIGPIYKKNTIKLDQLNEDLIFLSLI